MTRFALRIFLSAWAIVITTVALTLLAYAIVYPVTAIGGDGSDTLAFVSGLEGVIATFSGDGAPTGSASVTDTTIVVGGYGVSLVLARWISTWPWP